MKLRKGNTTWSAIVRAGALTAPVAAIAGSLCLGSEPASAQGKDLGTWMNSENKGKVALRECGEESLCGEIVWLKDSVDEEGQPWTDQLNPNPQLRDRPVIGINVLIGTKKIAPMTWQGQIYDPEVGKVYYLKHLKVGREKVEIKGCLSTGWPCRTKYWTRTQPVRSKAPDVQSVQRAQPARPAPPSKEPEPEPKVASKAQQAQPRTQASPPPVTPKIPGQAQQQAVPKQQQAAPPPQQAPRPPAQTSPQRRKPEVTAALPRTMPPNAQGGYLVQVAARQSHNEALQAFNELQRRYPQLLGGLAPQVLRADLGRRGVWYRVGVGPMLQQQAALNFCNQLKSVGADCLIRRR